MLQRTTVSASGARPDSAAAPASVHDVLRSPGHPLDAATRAFMEPRFGHDFSRVRVHTDAQAGESAHALNAHAYTVGNDVAFGSGNYSPETHHGRQLLAHELTHVVQQDGNHSGSMAKSKIEIGPPSDAMEREADAVAASITSQPAADQPAHSPLGPSAAPPLLQRKLIINPTDNVPQPGGKQTPLTVSIKGLLDDMCPDGNFQVDPTGNVAAEAAQFCQQPPPPPPRLAADVSSTPIGCGCICDVINNPKTTTIAFSPDGDPGTAPRSDPVAGPGQGGVPTDPTVVVDPTFRGQYLIDGKWVDVPFHLILTHELCGHALPKMQGAHVARGERPEGGTAPEERHAVDVERQVAAEHNPPLPQRPEDYGEAARQAPDDEFDPVEEPPVDLKYHPPIEFRDPTKLPPDVFKPIPPAPKGSGPKFPFDLLGKKFIDPIINVTARSLPKNLRDDLKAKARQAVQTGVAKEARMAAESAGLKESAGLDAIEKATATAIQEKGKFTS